VSWGAYFTCYNAARRRYAERAGGERATTTTTTTAKENFYAATEAGVVTTVLTNPIWVIKTRMQLQRAGVGDAAGASARGAAEQPYASFIDAFARIAAKEGLGGLYKGLVPSLVLVSHGSIQFVAYEHLKTLAARARRDDEDAAARGVDPSEAAAFGVLSKLCAATITYPVQVIRSRIQQRMDVRAADAPTYARFSQALVQTLSREGLSGLYKGMTPNILRVLPSSAVTFAAYETVTKLLARDEY
jgi:solute carrier family 25 folate transporter 32